MSEENDKAGPKWDKGDRAAIVAGQKHPIGTRGQIFWTGENKYGPGFRYGLRGDDGETYWCDEDHLGPEEGAPPPPDAPPTKPELARGTRVVITGGREGVGEKGEIFWAGPSKFGPGMRYGIKGEGEETWWADERDVEPVDPAEGGAPAADGDPGPGATAAPGGGPPPIDAPMPDPDAFADEEPIDDGAPFPDDIPF